MLAKTQIYSQNRSYNNPTITTKFTHHRNLHRPPHPRAPSSSKSGDVAISGSGFGNHCLNSCHFFLSHKLINTSRISSPPCLPQLWRGAHTAAWERLGRPQRKHQQRKYRTHRDGTCAIPGFCHPGFHSWLGEASGAGDPCLWEPGSLRIQLG